MSYELIIGIHDLIVHNYGPGRTLISLHAEVPSDGDLLKMHDTIDLIEHRLHYELQCNAVIHMAPLIFLMMYSFAFGSSITWQPNGRCGQSR